MRRSIRSFLSVVALTFGFGALGCASHSEQTRGIRNALDAGNPGLALGMINEKLDVDSAKELPKDTGGDNAVLLLDRAMVLQALTDYKLSSRDLEKCDKEIDLLDLSRNAAHDIGKYIFSDDTGPYKAPAYEKLMINTTNMVNYLVRGDLQGARVEARRLAVMQKYLGESDSKAKSLIGLGSYLAGFTFEKSGKPDEALRYYDEALMYGDYPSLADPIRRLTATSAYRTPRLEKAMAGAAPKEAGDEPVTELLVVVGYGRVPEKIARRLPIGLALTYAASSLSPSEAQQALALQGLVSWVNFPDLDPRVVSYSEPRLFLDERAEELEHALDLAAEARTAWREAQGAVLAGAITRLLTRVVAGEALRRSTKNEGVGLLLSLGAQATLTAVDTPDTRSWETLPARIALGRLRVTPGAHRARVQAGRGAGVRPVNVPENGWAVVAYTSLAGR